MKELKRLFTRKMIHRRVFSSLLAMLLVITSVIHPINMVPVYATSNWLRVNYQEQAKEDVEIYVQAEDASFEPGEIIVLDVFVQNNSSEFLKGSGLSIKGDTKAFTETEFILTEACGDASISDKGTVINLDLAPGETKALQFEGTLEDGLEALDRKEIRFFYGAHNESEEVVTATTEYQFTVGLFNELSIDFTDGKELIPEETNTIEITMGLNDLGYYYETDVATDSNAEVATDSDTNVETDSDAELATDSNAEADNTYVFDITGVTLNLETAGVKFEHVKLEESSVSEENGTITALVSYEVAADAEPGEYFGTLTASVANGSKTYKSETAFQFEVVDAAIANRIKKSGLFTAELENFTVHVDVAAGAFDEKVELVVTELAEDSEEFKTAEAAMENHDREYDGMMALDICFLNEAGEEVEPNEGYSVQVSIEMKAEVLPEGIDTESLMVHHIAETTTDDVQAEVVVEDVADTADATAGIVEVKEVDEAPVVAAEFSVESFSTFTITWVKGKTITVNYVTSDGVPLFLDGVQSSTVIANSSFDLKKFALSSYVVQNENETNETYSFVKAVFNDTYEYANVEDKAIEWSSEKGLLQYYANGAWNDITADSTLNLVYEKVVPGVTFKGEDTSGLINIYLKDFNEDYSAGSFELNKKGASINAYTNGTGVRQGIVDEVLDSEGYPALNSNTSTSLKQYFSDTDDLKGVKANYLFQLDENGYYYYDSNLNAAYLNTSNGEFGLYATPHATGEVPLGQEPQFMPYHKMSGEGPIDYTYEGKKFKYYPFLLDNGEKLKAIPCTWNAITGDYFFGMNVSFDFIMPKDGKIDIKDPAGNIIEDKEPQNMVFEFTGDDDVWVFIDDVLVLDLGGVHLRSGGKIDFATGVVTVDSVMNKTGAQTTTIKAMYDKAKAAVDSTRWASTKASKVVFDGDTFKDYSQHTLKFFYMERGAYGSNCKLKFNLQTIPEGTINFQKEIGYANVADAADIDFEFNTYVNYSGTDKISNDGTISRENYSLYKGKYEIYEASNMSNPIETGIASDGKIKLKDGQVARLVNDPLSTTESKITATSKFYVHEIGATSDKYTVVIDNVTVNQNNDQYDGAVTENLMVGDNPHIVFENNVHDTNKFNVKIQKTISDGTTPDTEFKFNLLLGNNEALYEGKYNVYSKGADEEWTTLKEGVEANNGVISIKAGQYAEVVGLVGGNTVKVQEIQLDNKVYIAPTYTIGGALASSNVEDGGYAKGTALEGNELNKKGGLVTITVQNNKKVVYTPVVISKKVTGNLGDWSKAFTFTVTATDMPEGISLPETGATSVTGAGTYTKNNDGTATITLKHGESITLSQVPVGATIIVAENDYSEERYKTTYSLNEGSATENRSASVTLTETPTTIEFTNEKNAPIDTGISMDTLPYILIMLAVIGGIVFTVIRKRKDDDLD